MFLYIYIFISILKSGPTSCEALDFCFFTYKSGTLADPNFSEIVWLNACLDILGNNYITENGKNIIYLCDKNTVEKYLLHFTFWLF